YRPSSLDVPTGDDGDTQTLGETIAEHDHDLENVTDTEALRPLMADLPERELRILHLRFWGNLTQAQIADKIGVSQMHVSRLLNRTLTRLRNQLTEPI
ncbi:sigma-70 family RNA polymerase sigma factor, partial [Spirillospora sp. NPDC047279]|uniref:sigma-70 family RNA polymerase sigma factor n=1 Tax=Spirillospora sp. NPDC047279 TaxID=3155478 RepID=UPI0033C45EF1